MAAEDAIYFETPEAFRDWLAAHHNTAADQWVGFYKVGADKTGITYKQAVDEALCYGWIDSARKSLDAARHTIRFTPRKPGSVWSLYNVGRVEALTQEGRMRPAGLQAFEARKAGKTGIYSFEQKETPELSGEETAAFQQHPDAWAFFQKQAPSYQRQATWWVISARQQVTRGKRFARLIEDSANGQRLAHLVYRKKES
jgi:uncharacterized protein YdeI (YjbR/CyaY-like superfamily)